MSKHEENMLQMAHISSNEPGSICTEFAAAKECLDSKMVENLKLEDGSKEQYKGEKAEDSFTNMSVNQDLSEKRKHLDNDKEPFSPEFVSDNLIVHKNGKCTKAVAFSIPVGNYKNPQQQLPKRFCSAKKSRKTNIESLNKKQELAEERRQQHKENRLKRIHERQEAVRKLAQNVDTLLQQQALAQSVTEGTVKRMSPSEILATARLVSNNFRVLSNQIGNDLTVKEKERTGQKECVVAPAPKKSSSSVAFTVICNGEYNRARPKQAFKQHQKRSALTSECLEEKQRQAEERRNKKKQLRSQRARENREALSAMAIDIERFKKLQSATELEENIEAAMLAEKLAIQFDSLTKRYSDDLKRAEDFQDCQQLTFLGL